MIEDITERKRAEARMEQLAQYDALTGLPNRSLFRDRLGAAMARAERNETMIARHVHRPRPLQGSERHARTQGAGDEVLQVAAGRLKDVLRKTDTVARLGGDEFTILLENIAHVDEVSQVAERIKEGVLRADRARGARDLHERRAWASRSIRSMATIVDALLQMADAAMYHAKKMGRNKYEFYAPEMNARAGERLKMEGLLRRALERGEFVLHYQPKVEIARPGGIVGVGSAVRWDASRARAGRRRRISSRSPKRPASSMPIGEWVLRTACADSRSWQDAGLTRRSRSPSISRRASCARKTWWRRSSRVLRETGLRAAAASSSRSPKA